jgi:Rrf2 family protein
VSGNSRFVVAVHVLTLLAQSGGEPVTSDDIAGSVNTNPAVIRRLLSLLARSGLVCSRLGAGGGARLGRPVAAITLLDVHRAVEPGPLFTMHPARPNPRCPVGRRIQVVIERSTRAAQQALEAELARRTVADVLDEVIGRERRGRRAHGAG